MGAILAAGIALAPLAAVVIVALGPMVDSLTGETFRRYAATSATLALLVGLGSALIGGLAAWLVALHDFPGRRVFAWALVTPLAAPAFVLAYGYASLFDVAGPIRTAWRTAFGWDPPLEMRTLWGAAIVMVLAFYPYVYLTLRAALVNTSSSLAEAARTMGLSRRQTFWRVTLPLARPALAAGVALAVMETLADYGATSYLTVQTLTTGVVRAWSIFYSAAEAARLALPLLAAAAVLLWIERASRRAVADSGQSRWREVERSRLPGFSSWLASLFCLSLIGLGLVLPLGWLAHLGWASNPDLAQLVSAGRNALGLGLVAALVTTALAALVALSARTGRFLPRLLSLGYATPGAVMAIGLLAPAGLIWRAFPATVSSFLMAIILLILAYASRLMAAALEPIDAGLQRISRSVRAAARSLGETEAGVARRVEVPLASGALFTAAMLVFIDVLKELPATMILRPFGFDTLAVMADHYAKDERLGEAAWPALSIVLIAVPAVIWLTRRVSHSRPGDSA